jgi:hypothetical protein
MSELAAGLIGGFIGGALGVIGTLVTSYWGPKKLEEWREHRREEHENGPRKRLLRSMLENPDYEIRSIEQLSRVSGTTPEECRRLLIEIGARGATVAGGGEGWALIERLPFDEEQ